LKHYKKSRITFFQGCSAQKNNNTAHLYDLISNNPLSSLINLKELIETHDPRYYDINLYPKNYIYDEKVKDGFKLSERLYGQFISSQLDTASNTSYFSPQKKLKTQNS